MMAWHAFTIGILGALVSAAAAAQSLSGPESIEYHPRLNRTLISNIYNGDIQVRSASGTLSLFTSAPTAPYGIELLAGTLYVVDSGHVMGYDIDSAAPVMDLPLGGAGFLNGITSNRVDTLYVSDFSAHSIYSIDVSDPGMPVPSAPVSIGSEMPNGLAYDGAGNRLLIATWDSNARILSLDLSPGATPATLIETSLDNLDGISLDCHGAIIVSAWSGCTSGGCLRRFNPPFQLTSPAEVIVDDLSNPADIDYDWVSADIAVPESGNDSVSFHASGCEPAMFASDFER